jgi:Domain of unknown function (DUF4440)
MAMLKRFATALSLTVSVAFAQPPVDDNALTRTISALDARVFDAYNRCDLAAFASYFVPKVEFYHDTGGATFDRKTVVDNTRKYITFGHRALSDAEKAAMPSQVEH